MGYKVYFLPADVFADPTAPTMAELNKGIEAVGHNMSCALTEEENMASVTNYGEGYPIPNIRVEDLLEVYPELDGDDSHEQFAESVKKAAAHIRGNNAVLDLRERIDGVFEHGHSHGYEDGFVERDSHISDEERTAVEESAKGLYDGPVYGDEVG